MRSTGGPALAGMWNRQGLGTRGKHQRLALLPRNMFPPNHTKLDGVTDTKRAFFMGNALVVGVIEKIGEELFKQINA